MIREIITGILNSYGNLFDNSHILIAVLIALLFLFLIRERLSFNPFALIIAPIGLLGAAFINVCALAKEKKGKWVYLFAIFLCAFFAACTGERLYSRLNVQKAENMYHIPVDYIEVMDYILSEDSDETIRVLAMPDYCMYHKMYSSRFDMLFENHLGDDVRFLDENARNAFNELSDNNPDMMIVSEAGVKESCKYVVLKKESYWPKFPLDRYDYEVIHETPNWEIFAKKGDNR